MQSSGDKDRSERWREEAAFFDERSDGRELTPLDPAIVSRYANPTGSWNIDFRFRLLGNIHGKRVVDVGCGSGENSLVLAALGAQVVGIDLSTNSLAVAQRRSSVSGLSERTTFVCCPFEEFDEGNQFDIVWCDAFLHHVIPELDRVLAKLRSMLRPGGLIVMAEPISLLHWLRRLRLTLPIPVHRTPGERPLEPAEIAAIRQHFPGVQIREYDLLSRLGRVIPKNLPYRTRVMNCLSKVDDCILRIPPLHKLAGTAAFWATVE